ncbi:MAG: LPXTG cell wall anchor domain-containing protein, partial [Longicatena sp.]
YLSTFVLMEKVVEPTKPTDPVQPAKPIDPVKPNENIKPTESNSPKTSMDSVNTGDTTMISLYIAILVVTAGIVLVLKKKSDLKKQ